MARLLLELIKFSTGAAVEIVYSTAVACLWSGNGNNGANNNTAVGGRLDEGRGETPRRVAPIDEYRRRSKLKAAQAARLAAEPPREKHEYVNVQRLLDTEMKEVFVLNDIPVLIEIPNVVIGDTPEIVERRQPEPATRVIIPIIKTPRREPVVEPEFSIYSHPSSPHLNKAMYITPVRQAFLASAGDNIDLTLLRAASERVSEILQENRRRIDAGEDPSTVRREARRKRAQEISTARQNRAGGIPLLVL